MKAIVYTEYGSPEVLCLKEVKTPIPKDNEVLIKIHAATVTAGDCELRRFDMPLLFWLPVRLFMGIRRPRMQILGQELAGEIEAVGKDVTKFKQGDPIFAPTEMNFGAYAEYTCLPSTCAMAIKPANVRYEEAAAMPTGGLNALYFLRKANIQIGEKVLINGAGGSIGTVAIQLAKHFGAEVTGVDSTEKLEMLRSIGADHVIDFTQEDFTKNGTQYDVIFDVAGKGSILHIINSLTPSGCYLAANPSVPMMLQGLWVSKTSNKKILTGVADYKLEDLDFLRELMEAGKIKAVIDRRYPLAQVAEAHRYVETGKKAGNVVINVTESR